MKRTIILILTVISFLSCNENSTNEKELSKAEKDSLTMYYRMMADTAEHAQNYELAVTYLDSVIAIYPHGNWYLQRASDKNNINDYEGALEDLNKAIEKGKIEMGRLNRTGVLIELGRYKEAEQDLQYLLQVQQDTAAYFNLYSLLYLMQNDPERMKALTDSIDNCCSERWNQYETVKANYASLLALNGDTLGACDILTSLNSEWRSINAQMEHYGCLTDQ